MSYLVIKSASNATPESYLLTSTTNGPRIAVGGSYIPLSTDMGGGSYEVKVNDGNTTYHVMRTSTSSYSQSASASITYLTTANSPDGMSNVTDLTRVSTSATLTRASTSATYTRASTSATLTRVSTSATLTRASTYETLTRASTYETLTRASTWYTYTRESTYATEPQTVVYSTVMWKMTESDYNYRSQWNPNWRVDCATEISWDGWPRTYTRVSWNAYWTISEGNLAWFKSGTYVLDRYYEYDTFELWMNAAVYTTGTIYYTRASEYAYETRESIYGYNTRQSIYGYNTRESVSGYATRESVSGYATRESVSGYGTRESISGYGTRSSTSGYSGVSSSSSSSSESASGTCWR